MAKVVYNMVDTSSSCKGPEGKKISYIVPTSGHAQGPKGQRHFYSAYIYLGVLRACRAKVISIVPTSLHAKGPKGHGHFYNANIWACKGPKGPKSFL